MYVEAKPEEMFAGMDRGDYISLGAAKDPGRRWLSSPVPVSASDLPNPLFWGLGQNYRVPRSVKKILRPVKVGFRDGVPLGANDADLGTAIAVGTAGLVVSAVVSFGMMVLATYVGARWAGCRR